jgi:hypothetical protein
VKFKGLRTLAHSHTTRNSYVAHESSWVFYYVIQHPQRELTLHELLSIYAREQLTNIIWTYQLSLERLIGKATMKILSSMTNSEISFNWLLSTGVIRSQHKCQNQEVNMNVKPHFSGPGSDCLLLAPTLFLPLAKKKKKTNIQ